MDDALAALDFAPDAATIGPVPDAAWLVRSVDGTDLITVMGNQVTIVDSVTGQIKVNERVNCPACTPVEHTAKTLGRGLALGSITVLSGPPIAPVPIDDPVVEFLKMLTEMFRNRD